MRSSVISNFERNFLIWSQTNEVTMGYKNLRAALQDLEANGMLIRIQEEVDPNLVMPTIQRLAYEQGLPALYFDNVKGSPFGATSNLFGYESQGLFLFRKSWDSVKALIKAKGDPGALLQNPIVAWKAIQSLPHALPRIRNGLSSHWKKCTLADLPQLKSWPMDGGPFLTLPLVYTEDPTQPGWQKSNLGMYRVQFGGNGYAPDECGIHYQLHRGIGIHHQKALQLGKKLKVSVFLGGPPSLTFAAVMPLPEGIPEVAFAGALGGRGIRLERHEGHVLATDADFCIIGEIDGEKPEGPFGDHLGYYSLEHLFPRMKVQAVYHRQDAIFPFTVVGRPPQEDTTFGALIHSLTDNAISTVLPGVQDVHAVDAAGVHPLLLAVGSERYVPYSPVRPMEILTQANAILGFGQTSLAKYLFMAAREDSPQIKNVLQFLGHCLCRIRPSQDLHFITKTTIDTLDYSGSGLNQGSKLILAAAGDPVRVLNSTIPDQLWPEGFGPAKCIAPGLVALQAPKYTNSDEAKALIQNLLQHLDTSKWDSLPWISLVDDVDFATASENNWLWITFTRSNPSHDFYGKNETFENKHWSCEVPFVVDCRIKPHHAPPLIEDADALAQAQRILSSVPGIHKWQK